MWPYYITSLPTEGHVQILSKDIYPSPLHLFRRLLSKKSRRSENQDQNEYSEDDGTVPCRTPMRQPKATSSVRVGNNRRESLNNTDQDTTDHSTYQVANYSKYGSS